MLTASCLEHLRGTNAPTLIPLMDVGGTGVGLTRGLSQVPRNQAFAGSGSAAGLCCQGAWIFTDLCGSDDMPLVLATYPRLVMAIFDAARPTNSSRLALLCSASLEDCWPD